MNLIQKIKLIFAHKDELKKALKVAGELKDANKKTSTDVKPGYKTTEFWAMAISILQTNQQALQGNLDPQVAAIITAVLTLAYNVLRFMQKS